MKKENKYGLYGIILMLVSGVCYLLVPAKGTGFIPLTILFFIALLSIGQWVGRAQEEIRKKNE